MSVKKRLQSLRMVMLLTVGVSLLIFTVIIFAIFYVTMPAMLLKSETKYLSEQRDMVQVALDEAVQECFVRAENIAVWDETVDFTLGENPTYIADNWPNSSPLANERLNFLLIKDLAGNDLYTGYYDYINAAPLEAPEGFSAHLNALADEVVAMYSMPRPAGAGRGPQQRGGVVFYDDTPYMVCAAPVLPSPDSRAISGVAIVGYRLDDAYFQSLTHLNDIAFDMYNVGHESELPAGIDRVSETQVTTTLSLLDMEGQPVLLQMTAGRPIYAEGQNTIDMTILLLVIALGLFATVLCAVIIRRVLIPIESLSTEIAVTDNKAGVDAGKYATNQEFYTLSTSINEMLERINQTNISLAVFLGILNGMDAFLYVTDPDTDEVLFMNDKMKEHFGLEGQVEGRLCWQVLQQGKTRRCAFCPVPALLENPQQACQWEEYNELTGRYYKNTDNLIEWTDGRLVHLQHSTDITESKLAEQELLERLEQQELMTAMSQSFIAGDEMDDLINNALRMTGEFLDVSKVVLARLDDNKASLCFEYFWYNDNKENVPHMDETIFPFREGEGMYDAFGAQAAPYAACSDIEGRPEYVDMRHSGVRAFLAAPIYCDGTLWGVLSIDECAGPREWSKSDIQLIRMIASVVSGVVARDETQKVLVRMSSIAESSPQYITYVNQNGQFEYVNQGAAALTGYSVDELRAGGMRLIFSPGDYERIMLETLPEVLAKGHDVFEMPITRKDGAVRIISFSTFTAGQKTLGVGAIGKDMTETRELETSLIEAKEQAEQSSLAKTSFLARMSHEMRTPMNAIIGMTNIAKTSHDPERKEYCLDKIGEASSHLLGVINDILDMSKIEAGKFELSYTEFDLEKMLRRITDVMAFRIEEKRQTFIVRMDKDVPRYIVSDEQRLSQVVTNLLGNAVKFTPEEGTITLAVRHEGFADGVDTLLLAMTDSGIGIAPEQQPKLFHSFEQADGGIARKHGGTGLGLAISKNIVDMMGGEIWIESALGAGATFLVRLRVKRGQNTAPRMLVSSDAWKKLRILVVDDAPDVREFFSALACEYGMSCAVAEGGDEALRLLDEAGDAPFDIAFVDYRMPGMDGVELARRLKGHDNSNMLVFMITAAEWGEVSDAAKAAGVDDYIPKPLFSSLIVDCVNRHLGATQQPQEPQQDYAADKDLFAGKRVLLAEDVEINREIVVSLLEDTGVQIECAENGVEVIEMFQKDPDRYDMIFMDIHMPEMDGYEATTHIRALGLPRAATIPIVAMTANVFREDVERCLAVGMNDHVGKPVNYEEIVAKMKKYLLSCT